MNKKRKVLRNDLHLAQFNDELKSLCRRIIEPYCDADIESAHVETINRNDWRLSLGQPFEDITITIKAVRRIHVNEQSGNSR